MSTTLARRRRSVPGARVYTLTLAVMAATGFVLIHGAPAAHADPGDSYLNSCTDPANQACFGSYAAVNLRNGPGTGYASEGLLYPGTIVSLCQVLGQNVGGNYIWDYVGVDPDAGTGLFVSDYYMNTPTYGTNRAYPCP